MTEDEMLGWHHQHGFGWTLGVGDGQGVLACCGSWGRKESDTTEWLSCTKHIRTDTNLKEPFIQPPPLTCGKPKASPFTSKVT